MKSGVLFLIALVTSGYGAVIYTEPVRVSGGGHAFYEYPPFDLGSSGYSISFGGSNDEVSVFVSSSGANDAGFGQHAYSTSVWGSRDIGLAWIGDYSSSFYSYFINRVGGGLTLYDADGNVTASVPIIGYFYKAIYEYRSAPGRVLILYQTQVLPTPEPAAWQLIPVGLGLLAWRLKKTPFPVLIGPRAEMQDAISRPPDNDGRCPDKMVFWI